MNYMNYDMRVIQKFQVKLIGWTYNKFISLFEIHTIDNICTLVQALHCRGCHSVRMMVMEVTKHAGDMEAKKAAGETIGKPRKVRSDLGSKRARKDPTDNNENEGSDNNEQGPAKKRKTAVRKSAMTSKSSAASKTTKRKSNACTSKSSKAQLPPAISKEFISDSDNASELG